MIYKVFIGKNLVLETLSKGYAKQAYYRYYVQGLDVYVYPSV